MADVFISYSRKDAETARRFAEAFRAAGFTVWWDDALRSGEAFDSAIEAALHEAKAVVVLWSRESVTSRWVRAEAAVADRSGKLASVMIEPCERPVMFELAHTADLVRWRGRSDDPAWVALVEDVRRRTAQALDPAPAVTVLESPAAARPSRSDKPWILILPFQNMSGDPEQEFFSDGVTEDVITDLGKIAGLGVVSRSSAFALKGRSASLADLVERFGVGWILEGSVRKSGDRVRVTAQLTDAAGDEQVWAERFDRTLDDIFAVQEEISRAVVSALQLRLAPSERAAIERKATASAEAYELYLMARQFYQMGAERHQSLIVRLCRSALEIDPDYARAWAMLSWHLALIHQRGRSGSDGVFEAQKAIAIEPSLAMAHASLANAYARLGLFEAGLEAAQAAVALDPECGEALKVAGLNAIALRRFEDAAFWLEQAVRIDPEDYRSSGMVMQAYAGLDRPAETLAAARRTLSIAERAVALQPDNGSALGMGVAALAKLGEADRTKAWARRAVLVESENHNLRYNIACALATLGEAEAAVDMLESLTPTLSAGVLRWIEEDNDLDPVRDHARFKALMKRFRATLTDREDRATPPAAKRPVESAVER